MVTPAERLWRHWRRWVDLETTGQGLHRMDGKMGLDPSVDSSGALRWERPSALMFLVPGLYIYIYIYIYIYTQHVEFFHKH